MRKVLLFLFLLTAGLVSTESKAQQGPAEIRNVPPAVLTTFQEQMRDVYIERFGRYGTTTWYMDKGSFMSITVFRYGSTFIRLFMRYTPQGDLLSAETDE